MKRKITLTETQLKKLIRDVISEQSVPPIPPVDPEVAKCITNVYNKHKSKLSKCTAVIDALRKNPTDPQNQDKAKECINSLDMMTAFQVGGELALCLVGKIGM